MSLKGSPEEQVLRQAFERQWAPKNETAHARWLRFRGFLKRYMAKKDLTPRQYNAAAALQEHVSQHITEVMHRKKPPRG